MAFIWKDLAEASKFDTELHLAINRFTRHKCNICDGLPKALYKLCPIGRKLWHQWNSCWMRRYCVNY